MEYLPSLPFIPHAPYSYHTSSSPNYQQYPGFSTDSHRWEDEFRFPLDDELAMQEQVFNDFAEPLTTDTPPNYQLYSPLDHMRYHSSMNSGHSTNISRWEDGFRLPLDDELAMQEEVFTNVVEPLTIEIPRNYDLYSPFDHFSLSSIDSHSSGSSANIFSWEDQFRFPMNDKLVKQEQVFDNIADPLMIDFPSYYNLDSPINHLPSITYNFKGSDFLSAYNGFRNNDIMNITEEKSERLPLDADDYSKVFDIKKVIRNETKVKRNVNNSECNARNLTTENIKKYFYMPITQAAKNLNVGLSLLKKRCRELKIERWPYRKLVSIQTLIKTVQQECEGDEDMKKARVELLEMEKLLLEEMPDKGLEKSTKRLRQTCFKNNYKKRKSSSSMKDPEREEDCFDDEMISLIYDVNDNFPSSACSLL